jgi:serine/threonine protein kinase
MTAVSDRTEFLQVLERSKLLDPATLGTIQTAGDLPEAAGELAERLVQQGTLTRFQARSLLDGQFRGLVVGPYRLLDQIGQGGMGTVYLAEHSNLKKKVAVKVLGRDQAGNKAAVDRFHREARAASALCHPNIVRMHHVGQAVGVHYLVMEYVDGATLERVLDRKGPFSVEEAVKVTAQAAAGLQHAHEKGFVHRDVSPRT